MTLLDRESAASDAGFGPRALSVALARALESTSTQPLFTDPYAQLFVDAAGPVAPPSTPEDQRSLTDYAAARTKWFDDFFTSSSSAGVAQVVILAAGLDARAWRLPWLSDSVVYEVDQPKVLAFKQRILVESGVAPAARYVPVSIDLRDDWPHALTGLGFDHTEPTAWAAEGLFPHLTAQAQIELFERIELYSARGSRIAVEDRADVEPDLADWLCAHHWEVNSTPATDLMDRYHRVATPGADPVAHGVFVDGRKL